MGEINKKDPLLETKMGLLANKMKKDITIINLFETDRLSLRKLEPADCEDLFKILSDPETMKFYPQPYSREETKNWILRSRQSYLANRFGLWAVILKSENRFIGQCGISLQNIDGKTVAEIGYHINKHYWNKGFATEAAQKCLWYGFHKLGLKEIFIHTYTKNIPSMKIAEKLGMKRIAEYDKVVNQSGTVMRHIVYALKKK